MVALRSHWYQAYNSTQDPAKANLKMLSTQGCLRCPRLGLDPTNAVLVAATHVIVEDVGMGSYLGNDDPRTLLPGPVVKDLPPPLPPPRRRLTYAAPTSTSAPFARLRKGDPGPGGRLRTPLTALSTLPHPRGGLAPHC